jgi:hypothetical protein
VVAAADAGKALRLRLKQKKPRGAQVPRGFSLARPFFENSLSFQQSRPAAANARCAHSAIYSTDAAPVWRDHYVTLICSGTVGAGLDSNIKDSNLGTDSECEGEGEQSRQKGVR